MQWTSALLQTTSAFRQCILWSRFAHSSHHTGLIMTESSIQSKIVTKKQAIQLIRTVQSAGRLGATFAKVAWKLSRTAQRTTSQSLALHQISLLGQTKLSTKKQSVSFWRQLILQNSVQQYRRQLVLLQSSQTASKK